MLEYLRKLVPFIAVFCVLATYGIYMRLKSSNTYVASEVIHYNDEGAEQGMTPTGENLDVNEIKSSAVMSKVVERMGLAGIYSVDSLISRVSITPIPDGDKVARKQAKLDEGEEYVYEPSTFVVSFTATNREGEGFARSVLDETLDVYFAEYSRKYVNVAPANNTVKGLKDGTYDYIEIMELIDADIEETLDTLYKRMAQNNYYRSTENGVSFADLAEEFNYLRDVRVSSLFSRIYKHKITKNKTVLVSDYTTRIDNNDISDAKEASIVNDIVAVIDAYVEKMRESGNTDITYEYILDNVHERSLLESYGGDQTVTYDELIYSWRDHNEKREHSLIDSAYCRYVIDTFSKCTGLCENGECQSSPLTCTELNDPDYRRIRDEIDAEINALVAELTKLYDLTVETNNEYNEYLGASYISVLASSSVRPSINVKLYTAIAFVFLMVVFCGGAAVLARIGDIINHVFYTDSLTGLGNRACFDKYLKDTDKKHLEDGTVYCMTDISNLTSINTEYGRSAGDEVIRLFTRLLTEAFGKTRAEYIYNGNGSFIVLARDTDYGSVGDIMRIFALRLDEREDCTDIALEYKVGIAEKFGDSMTARKLLSETIKNKKQYSSMPVQPLHNGETAK